MAVFRVEKTRDYTVMANHHLKSRTLTLKAKGLLSVILSLPDTWDYTLKGLACINREGIDAIREGIKELEDAGYIDRIRTRNEMGHLKGTEYVIYEKPRDARESPTLDFPTQVKSPSGERNAEDRLMEAMMDADFDDFDLDFPDTEPFSPTLDYPTLDNPTLEKPTLDDPTLGNPTLGNPTQLSTKGVNTHGIKYPSIHPEGMSHVEDGWDGLDFSSYPVDLHLKPIELVREIVRENIGYYDIVTDSTQERLCEIVELMVEVLRSKRLTLNVAGDDHPTPLIQERFRALNAQHIGYVFECMEKNRSKVRNIKKYLLATLFNAPVTMGSYYDALVRHKGLI